MLSDKVAFELWPLQPIRSNESNLIEQKIRANKSVNLIGQLLRTYFSLAPLHLAVSLIVI